MPNAHRHPRRSISGIPPELWQKAQAKAARLRAEGKDTTVSGEIVRMLERWVARS